NNQFESWAYDDAHNLKSRTTVGNQTQSFGYDNRNQKKTMTWQAWASDAEWAYYSYDGVGRLTQAVNGTGIWNTNIISTVTRTYDDAGRMTLDRQDVSGLNGARDVNYAYDADGKQ